MVRPGGLYVAPGLARREQGAHYTPPSLTEPIVRTALEPQVFRQVNGQLGVYEEPRMVRSPRELLDLKICDPAMGSGAFLVQAVRYLAERLVDSWESHTPEVQGPRAIPYGDPSSGRPEELLLPEEREERVVWARRLVVERCIYGVDKNPLAVEMAKLSLWIETLAVGKTVHHFSTMHSATGTLSAESPSNSSGAGRLTTKGRAAPCLRVPSGHRWPRPPLPGKLWKRLQPSQPPPLPRRPKQSN